MRAHPAFSPLAAGFLALIALLACNLTPRSIAAPAVTVPASTPGGVQTTSTDAPASQAGSPTPFDPSSLPSVESMGRLSLMEGWVQTGGRLLWTGDAGGTWLDITPPGLPACLGEIGCPSSVDVPFLLDASHIWLPVLQGQEQAPPTTLSVFYTGNGGGDWASFTIAEFAEPLFCPGSACLSGIDLDFVDPLNGWLAAYAPMGNISDRQYLYRTGDGGQSWVPLSMPLSGRITFLDAATGWAAGGATRWSSDQLLRTQDGGSSWQAASLAFPEPYSESLSAEYSWYQAPVFFSGESAVLPVRFDQPQGAGKAIGFYTTEDGGGSWALATTLQDQEMQIVGELFPIPWSAIDETTWYVSINEARQYLTRDRGQSWEAFPAAGLGGVTLLDVRFVTEAEGWGLGLICGFESGCLQPMFATHDGGRSWAPMAPAP